MLAMADYTPTARLADALTEFRRVQEQADAARENLREAIAEELKTQDVTSKSLAPHTPWSDETIRGIARDYDVPLKRQPTVKAIKPRKKPGGQSSG